MTVGALIEKLAEYPDTMEVEVQKKHPLRMVVTPILEITEVPVKKNTVIIKI